MRGSRDDGLDELPLEQPAIAPIEAAAIVAIATELKIRTVMSPYKISENRYVASADATESME
jgi:hypothetical protein